MKAAVALAIAVVAACVSPSRYRCAVDDDCGAGGVCGADGACVGTGGDGGDRVDAPPGSTVARECVPGEQLARAATSCPAVCDRLPSCCEVSWTRMCVQLAEIECDVVCGGRIVFASTDAVDGFDIALAGGELALTPMPAFGTVGQAYRSVAWADFDRDGVAELLVTTATGNVGGDEMWVLRPGATWETVTDLRPFGRAEAFEVGSGDYDDDGQLDIVMSGIAPSVKLVRGLPTGVMFEAGPEPSMGVDGYFATSFDSGDYDADGDDDVIVIDYYNGNGRIMRWNDDRFEDGPTFGPFSSPRRVRFGDVDGDHDLDVAIAHNDTVLVLRTTGGAFEATPLWSYTFASASFTDAAWIDLDGDRDLDLAAIGDHFEGGPLRFFENTGADLSDQPIWTSVTREQAWKLAVADVDGDHDLDVAVASDATPNRIFLNDGDRTFSVGWTAASVKPSFGVALTGRR